MYCKVVHDSIIIAFSDQTVFEDDGDYKNLRVVILHSPESVYWLRKYIKLCMLPCNHLRV